MNSYDVAHNYMLSTAMVVLLIGAIQAAIISPVFLKGKKFAHDQSRGLQIFAGVILFIVIAGLISLSIGLYGNLADGLISLPLTFWQVASYWQYFPQAVPDTFTFFYIYSLTAFAMAMSFTFAFICKWKPDNPPATAPAPDTHAFLIVAHNSSKTGIDITIKALLKLVRPHQIYVADNGSTEKECIDTDELCNQLSLEYYESYPELEKTFIQVSHLSFGNKSLAQYAAVYAMNQKKDKGQSKVEYVTIIDDDVTVPPNWRYESIEKQFEDETRLALAYPLSVGNASVNIITRHQDMEYLTGDCDRFGWYNCGNQMFASGAIATWRIRPFMKVLERHCSCFNGEDLEMGFLMHKLCDESTDKLGVDTPARFGFVHDTIVPTDAPFCLVHWFDFLPANIKKKRKLSCKTCNEHSFFNQRLRSWDCANHAFFFKYIRIIVSPRGWGYKYNNFIRMICLWKMISISRDVMCFGTWLLFIYKAVFGANPVGFLMFLLDTAVIAWAVLGIYLSVTSYKLGKANRAFPPESIFVEPLVLIAQITLMNSWCSIMYSLCYYFWLPFPDPIRDQIKKNAKMELELHHVWDENKYNEPQRNHRAIATDPISVSSTDEEPVIVAIEHPAIIEDPVNDIRSHRALSNSNSKSTETSREIVVDMSNSSDIAKRDSDDTEKYFSSSDSAVNSYSDSENSTLLISQPTKIPETKEEFIQSISVDGSEVGTTLVDAELSGEQLKYIPTGLKHSLKHSFSEIHRNRNEAGSFGNSV
ncbi:hypothetical protein HDV06_006938 [Boothiomyces sp. JEL0866]|nr:hypothetical protein HDV06_006938 [Boothiomyces sp. JEL0866]